MLHTTTEMVAAIAAILAVVVSIWNTTRIHHVHLSLNSRLTALLNATREAAHAAGRNEERETERKRGK